MLENLKNLVQNSRIVQLLLSLVLGIAIGAIFYPTKRIEERLTKKHQEELSVLNEQHKKEIATEHEEYSKLEGKYNSYHSESEKKITTLTSQVTTLKSKQKTAYYKVVRPDGTVEIQKFSESEVDESTKVISQIQSEFKEKVDSIEQKWSEIHKKRVAELKQEYDSKEQEYKKTIDELEKTKVVEINKKSFGAEAGIMLNSNYYGHITYDLFGPFIVGLHGQFGSLPSAGIGLGIRF